jgi:sulfopyruvate decarboxylase subunit beta
VIHIRIEPGNAQNIPLLLMDPVVLTARFRSWLHSV